MDTERYMKNELFDLTMPDDELHEECGVFGMYDFDGEDVASTIYYGLFALPSVLQSKQSIIGQHRQILLHRRPDSKNAAFFSDFPHAVLFLPV